MHQQQIGTTPRIVTNRRCLDKNTVQHLIFFFHDERVRRFILDKAIGRNTSKLRHWGTLYVSDGSLHDELQTQLHPRLHQWHASSSEGSKGSTSAKAHDRHEALFSVCISYEEVKVHYVSIVLRRDAGAVQVLSFDPGSRLYPRGEKQVIPAIMRTLRDFYRHTPPLDHSGMCPQKFFNLRFGIQFDGRDPMTTKLPADAFCQSWSLLFLVEWIYRSHLAQDDPCDRKGPVRKSVNYFVQHWCKLAPRKRSLYLLSSFALPVLIYHATLRKRFCKMYGSTHCNFEHLRHELLDKVWLAE